MWAVQSTAIGGHLIQLKQTRPGGTKELTELEKVKIL